MNSKNGTILGVIGIVALQWGPQVMWGKPKSLAVKPVEVAQPAPVKLKPKPEPQVLAPAYTLICPDGTSVSFSATLSTMTSVIQEEHRQVRIMLSADCLARRPIDEAQTALTTASPVAVPVATSAVPAVVTAPVLVEKPKVDILSSHIIAPAPVRVKSESSRGDYKRGRQDAWKKDVFRDITRSGG